MKLTMPVVSHPPRHVPLSTKLVVLFGGQMSFFGWFFFTFGMAFAWVFAGNADWSSLISFQGPLESASGVITSSEKTNFSQGKGRSGGNYIYAHHYQFQFAENSYEGISYRTGGGLRAGETVTVEFHEDNPGCSRIRGMRRAPLGMAAALVLIFPAVGIGVTSAGLLNGRKAIRLLNRGELGEGRLVGKKETNVRQNKRPVFRLTFEFRDMNGQIRQCVVRTADVKRLEDDPVEWLFYDPHHPSRAVLLDSLPGRQGFAANGELKPCSIGRAVGVLLLPALAVLSVVLGLCWKFL